LVNLPQIQVNDAQVAEGSTFAAAVADLTTDAEGFFEEADRRVDLGYLGVGVAEVAEGIALAKAVADLTTDEEGLFEEADRHVNLPQMQVRQPPLIEQVSHQRTIHFALQCGSQEWLEHD